jgi:hypothetical protein
MKRTVILVTMVVLVFGVFAVNAQEQDPKLYVKTVGIMKILNHALGYKVLYLKSTMEVGEFYVPHSWFKAGGKAELILGSGPAFPYFSVFYRDAGSRVLAHGAKHRTSLGSHARGKSQRMALF